MTKPKKQKDYRPMQSLTGMMHCEQEHYWEVKDLNPERKTVTCPRCGGLTSIATGFENGR